MALRHVGMLLAVFGAALGFGLAIYPSQRVCTWFEFLTDGYAPDTFANLAQNCLGRMWRDGFERNATQQEDEPASAMSAYLTSTRSRTVVELAAGGGLAAARWTQLLREQFGHEDARLLLTDLQPNPRAWDRLAEEFAFVSYSNRSVDATKMGASLEGVGAQPTLRMINLALHHFSPSVRSALAG